MLYNYMYTFVEYFSMSINFYYRKTPKKIIY